jgi:hypothetical protein
VALCARLPSLVGAGLRSPERSASHAVQSGHQLPRLSAAASSHSSGSAGLSGALR